MKKSALLQIALLACAGVVLSACVSGSSSSGKLSLEQQVQQHDSQLKQLQPAQADTWNQLQAMRQELNAIKGQLDDLQNIGGAQALAQRVSAHDAALRQVERSMALNLDLGEPMSAAPAASPAMNSAGQAPAAPAALGPGEGTWGQPTPQPVLQVPQKDISLALYDAGVNAYNARKYDEAQRSFADFLP